MTGAEAVSRRLLGTVWWIAFPPFLVIVLRFSYERACLNPYELLQPIMQRQAGAVVIAAIYLGGYAWFVAASVITARSWDTRAAVAQIQAIWGPGRFKMFAMAGALVLDQVPRAAWAWLYRAGGLC